MIMIRPTVGMIISVVEDEYLKDPERWLEKVSVGCDLVVTDDEGEVRMVVGAPGRHSSLFEALDDVELPTRMLPGHYKRRHGAHIMVIDDQHSERHQDPAYLAELLRWYASRKDDPDVHVCIGAVRDGSLADALSED